MKNLSEKVSGALIALAGLVTALFADLQTLVPIIEEMGTVVAGLGVTALGVYHMAREAIMKAVKGALGAIGLGGGQSGFISPRILLVLLVASSMFLASGCAQLQKLPIIGDLIGESIVCADADRLFTGWQNDDGTEWDDVVDAVKACFADVAPDAVGDLVRDHLLSLIGGVVGLQTMEAGSHQAYIAVRGSELRTLILQEWEAHNTTP